jgi:hypothetical protein
MFHPLTECPFVHTTLPGVVLQMSCLREVPRSRQINGSAGVENRRSYHPLVRTIGAGIHAADPTDHQWEVGMSVHRRNFLVLAALAAAAASPALGQTAAPAGGAANTQSAAFVPDFSGVWAHAFWPGFDPPLSGPGPVVNRSRLRNGVGNSNQLVGDYTNPILQPHAADVVKKHGEISLTGVTYPTPANQCWPQPVPYIFWTIGVQLLQQPDQVTILYSNPDHEFRQVRLNQRHPAKVAPSWYGDSVGHYEGDTLVIDTVGIKSTRPYAMVDIYGTPYTEGLHVVERYRLVDYEAAMEAQERTRKENVSIPNNDSGLIVDASYKGKGLQLVFTVEDDGVFTMPWSATMTYRRASGAWPEFVCAENIREYYNNKDSEVPRADKPDF